MRKRGAFYKIKKGYGRACKEPVGFFIRRRKNVQGALDCEMDSVTLHDGGQRINVSEDTGVQDQGGDLSRGKRTDSILAGQVLSHHCIHT